VNRERAHCRSKSSGLSCFDLIIEGTLEMFIEEVQHIREVLCEF
jgi:hypothetical protein